MYVLLQNCSILCIFGKTWLYIVLHDFNLIYYSSIILGSFSILLFPKLCWHIGLTPTYATSFLVANMFTLQMLNKLTKRINPLMLPLSTVRFYMNNIITNYHSYYSKHWNNNINNQVLEHLLHLDVHRKCLLWAN